MTTQQLVDNRTAAQLLGIAPGTLSNWRWRGIGPRFIQLGNQAIRYRLVDLEAFVAQRVRQAPVRRTRSRHDH